MTGEGVKKYLESYKAKKLLQCIPTFLGQDKANNICNFSECSMPISEKTLKTNCMILKMKCG